MGTPSSAHISGDQARLRMSNNMVRLAFDGSVACTAPPVSFDSSQVSMVPKARSASTGMWRLRNNHSTFVPEK